MTIDALLMDRSPKVSESPAAIAVATLAPAPASAAIPVAATASAAAPVNTDEVKAAVAQLQAAISNGPNPDFKLDYLSGLSVVTVRSTLTGEVVYQLPDSRALDLARMIKGGASVGSIGLFKAIA